MDDERKQEPAEEQAVTLNEKKSEPELSAREAEILVWVAQGKSNTDIAEILEISPHTVSTHLKRILHKLNASSRTTAAVRAAQWGLLPPI